MPEAHQDPLARLRAAAAAREAAGLGFAVAPAGADVMAAIRALHAVRDHVRTAPPVGRK